MIRLSTIAYPLGEKLQSILIALEDKKTQEAEKLAMEITENQAKAIKLLKHLEQLYLYNLSQEKDACAQKMIDLNHIFDKIES